MNDNNESNKTEPEVTKIVVPQAAAGEFDFARIRLPQDFDQRVAVKKLLNTVPVRKPSKQEWVRVHETWSLAVGVIEIKEQNEHYLVDIDLLPDLADEVRRKMLYAAISRQGVVFIWPLALPDVDGLTNTWNSSAMDAAEEGKKQWIRVQSNRALGAYETWTAPKDLGEPAWPEVTFKDLVKVAFKDKLIGSLEHPIVRMLKGL